MKYFTYQWWMEGRRGHAAFDEYRAYYAGIRSRLPGRLVNLDEEHTLHDSRIERIAMEGGSITMNLAGWDRELTKEMTYELKFLDVLAFKQAFPKGRNVESEMGDLGYYECEWKGDHVEMRMLFASSAEFSLSFHGFEYIASLPNH